MKEYMKYADDYLFMKLKDYNYQKTELLKAREMISGHSVLAYLSITASIRTLQKKIDAVVGVLTNRDYSEKDIQNAIHS
jgi:hypothetical protein